MKSYRTNRRQNEGIRLVQKIFGQDWKPYNATFARELHSINAAIFYQQCCYWTTKIDITRDGWFYKTIAEFEEELGMSRYEQETAIKILLKHKLIEKKRGYMGVRYFRITNRILEFGIERGMLKSSKPDCGNPTDRSDGNNHFIYKDYSKTTKDLAAKKRIGDSEKYDRFKDLGNERR